MAMVHICALCTSFHASMLPTPTPTTSGIVLCTYLLPGGSRVRVRVSRSFDQTQHHPSNGATSRNRNLKHNQQGRRARTEVLRVREVHRRVPPRHHQGGEVQAISFGGARAAPEGGWRGDSHQGRWHTQTHLVTTRRPGMSVHPPPEPSQSPPR